MFNFAPVLKILSKYRVVSTMHCLIPYVMLQTYKFLLIVLAIIIANQP